jgi:hypothetical protein
MTDNHAISLAVGSAGAPAFSRLRGIDHFVQPGSGLFDIEVFVLTCAAFRRNDSAAVDLLEISVREFVSLFGFLIMLLVDAQMPLGEFAEAVRADEFIFVPRRRLVFAPCIALVGDEFCPAHKTLGMVERALVYFYGHKFSSLYRTGEFENVDSSSFGITPSKFSSLSALIRSGHLEL